MSNLDQYNKLKKTLDDKQREADKAAGALEQTLKAIKTEFGVGSLSEAKELLIKLEKEQKEAEDKFETEFKKLQKEYGHLLD